MGRDTKKIRLEMPTSKSRASFSLKENSLKDAYNLRKKFFESDHGLESQQCVPVHRMRSGVRAFGF
jgi:hypothetical protein